MGFWSTLSVKYENFKDSSSMESSREFFKYHPGNISIDSNQAGTTMTSRHDAAKHGLSFALIPGAGKITYKVGRAAFGFSRPQSVVKVIWPLWLSDNPPGMLVRYVDRKLQQHEKSRGQHGKSGSSGPSVPAKTPRGTKPSRRASPGKTSKPFWSNGKPKCKKGFRYDYKRKLCVKIK